MADNRVAYGLAKKYGIDTEGMSPKEVWDALKEKGVTEKNISDGAYNSKDDGAKALANKVAKQKTIRLNYSGEEIPYSAVRNTVESALAKTNWNLKDEGERDMAIKDAAGALLKKHDEMSYKEALDLARQSTEEFLKEQIVGLQKLKEQQTQINPKAKTTLEKYAERYNYSWDEVESGINKRIKGGMFMDAAISDILEDMVALKKL